MAQNKSGTTVYAHREDGSGYVIVGPGEEFPEGVSYDEALAKDGSEEEVEVAGPSQLSPGPAGANSATGWRGVTVPQIREALGKKEIEFSEAERKDDLIAKAEAAGLAPSDFEG